MRYLLLSAFVASTSALVVNGPVAPQRSMATRMSSTTMMAKVDDKFFTGLTAKTAEEKRRLRIMDGANWRPRTYPKEGEGYFFFQGPTPKTAVQKDLPSFFSAENFADLTISPVQIGVTAVGFASAAIVASTLFGTTTPAVKPSAPAAVTKPAPAPKKEAPKKEESKKEETKAAPKAEAPKAADKPAPP